MYFKDFTAAMAAATGRGRKSRLQALRHRVKISFSSNSRLMARAVWSGTRSSFSAPAKENRDSAPMTPDRSCR